MKASGNGGLRTVKQTGMKQGKKMSPHFYFFKGVIISYILEENLKIVIIFIYF